MSRRVPTWRSKKRITVEDKMDQTQGARPIDAICANVVNAQYEAFDQATLMNAKLRILDVLGCNLLGAMAEGSDALVDKPGEACQ